MPFKSEKQKKWMYANEPEMAKKWSKKESLSKSQIKKMRDEFDKTGELPPHLKKIAKGKKEFEKKFKVKDIEIPGLEWMSKLAEERDYKAEYKKFQSSTKAKKYRAELNKYNRQKGTYGNGDGKDASHKGGKIVGFESQSKNRGRAEKSRLKKEIDDYVGNVIDEYTLNEESKVIKSIQNLAKKNKYGTVNGTRMNAKTANMIMKIYNHPKMKKYKKAMDNYTSDELADMTIKMPKILGIKEGAGNSADAKKVEKLLIKYGNTKKDVADMMKNYDYVSKTYRNAKPAKKAEILSSLQEVNEGRPKYGNLRLTKEKPKKITNYFWSAPKRIMTKRAYLRMPDMVKKRKNGVDYVGTAIGPKNTLVYIPVIFKSAKEIRSIPPTPHPKLGGKIREDRNASILQHQERELEKALKKGDEDEIYTLRNAIQYTKSKMKKESVVNELQKMRPAVKKLLKQKGYGPIFQAIDNSKRQFKQMRYSRGEIQDTLIDMFGDEDPKILQKIKESVNEKISKEEWAQYPAYARKLKPYMQKLLKIPLKVRVIKQANHNPWIEIRVAKFGKDTIPNDFRKLALKAIGGGKPRDMDNINYGNITTNSVSMLHNQWVKLLGNKVKV